MESAPIWNPVPNRPCLVWLQAVWKERFYQVGLLKHVNERTHLVSFLFVSVSFGSCVPAFKLLNTFRSFFNLLSGIFNKYFLRDHINAICNHLLCVSIQYLCNWKWRGPGAHFQALILHCPLEELCPPPTQFWQIGPRSVSSEAALPGLSAAMASGNGRCFQRHQSNFCKQQKKKYSVLSSGSSHFVLLVEILLIWVYFQFQSILRTFI